MGLAAGGDENRHEAAGQDRLLEAAHHLLGAELLALQVLLKQGVVALCGGFYQCKPGFFGLILKLGGDFLLVLPFSWTGLHGEQVDDPLEVLLLTPGQLHRDEGGFGG